MRSLCCPLKQRLLERRKQGEWVRRLLQIHQEKVDGGWDGKPEGWPWGWWEVVQVWKHFEWEPAGLLLDVTGGVRGWEGSSISGLRTGWNEGDSQSSRLERERKRKNGISGGDSWILRCLLVPHVEILSSGGCSRRNWVKVNVWAYELHIKMRGVWGDSQGNMWGWGEENKEENPETV